VSLTVTGPFGSSTLTQTNFILAAVQLIITNLRLSGSDVVVSFTSAAGQSYSLDYSDDFSPKGWNTAVDAVPGTGDIVTVTHFGGANGVSRFYRVRQTP
jgi:PKD repeat protein